MPCRHAEGAEIKRHSFLNFGTLPRRGRTPLGGWCEPQSHSLRFREETIPLAPDGNRQPVRPDWFILQRIILLAMLSLLLLFCHLQHYNGKGTFIPVCLFEKHKWSDVVAQSILNLGTRRKRMVNLSPGPVYPQGRSLRCYLNRWLAGILNQYEHPGEIIFSDLSGNPSAIPQSFSP
jgi:hypothetical protein